MRGKTLKLGTNNQKRKIMLFFTVALMGLCIMISLIPRPANAADSSDITSLTDAYNKNHSACAKAGGLSKVAFEMAATAIGGNPNFSVTQLASDFLQIGVKGTAANTKDVWDNIGKAYDAVRVTGITLMTLYFFLSLVEKVSSDSFTAELVIKKLIGFVLCVIIVLNGRIIIDAIKDFSNALLQDTTKFFTFGFGVEDKIETMASVANTLTSPKGSIGKAFAAIGVMLEYLLPYVAQFAFLAFAIVAGITRLIELLVRYMFAPIGMAPLVADGMHGSGARYIKKIAACLINGAVMVAVIYLATSLNVFFTGFMGALTMTAFPLAGLGFILKTQAIADDIAGVH